MIIMDWYIILAMLTGAGIAFAGLLMGHYASRKW